MATVTSHTLDCVLGTHAGGIEVEMVRIDPSGKRVRIFLDHTDEGGRLLQELELFTHNPDDQFEMVFQTGAYFAKQEHLGNRIIQEVVIRFHIPDPSGRYHIPLMLAPNSYSVWWSD
tara:strand:+ start:52 stop:402 length:351 start_codon:yes stop_codon:yes gene_type:complete